jgi:hypothetical protein
VRSAESWTDRFELLLRVLYRRALSRIGDRGTLGVGRRMPDATALHMAVQDLVPA